MLCLQLLVYIMFIIIQAFISHFIFMLPFTISSLVMPLLLIILLHYLCVNYHFTVANVLIGVVIILGLISDIYIAFNLNNIQQVARKIFYPAYPTPGMAPAAQQVARPTISPVAPASHPGMAPAAQQVARPTLSPIAPATQIIQPHSMGYGTGSGSNYAMSY